MTNRSKLLRVALGGVLALTLGAPMSWADDRCDRRSYDGRRVYVDNYRGPAVDYNGYRGGGGYSYGYSDSRYRDYGYYRNDGYYGYDPYRRQRSAGKSAAIIGGSAAAGAVVGAMAGGGKGAAVGAAVGALGGLVFDRATKDRNRRYGWR